MYACSLASLSMNGCTIKLVAKLKTSPNVIEIGNAGNAFRNMASSSKVKHRPCNNGCKIYTFNQDELIITSFLEILKLFQVQFFIQLNRYYEYK